MKPWNHSEWLFRRSTKFLWKYQNIFKFNSWNLDEWLFDLRNTKFSPQGYSTVQSLLRQLKSCPSLSPLKIFLFSTIKNNLGSNSLQQKRKGHTIISDRVWISYVIRLTALKFIIKEKIPRTHIKDFETMAKKWYYFSVLNK